jgi:hypothetical protein
MGFEFKEIDHGWEQLKRAFKTLQQGGSYVKAGILGEAAQRTPTGKLSTVELAMIHEFGTADGHIPARPFVRSAFEKNRPAYVDLMKALARKVYSNEMTVEQMLRVLGLRMEADIRKGVTEGAGVPPPNAPSTIAAKGSSRPLVDTGRMIGSVTSEVVLKPSGKDE